MGQSQVTKQHQVCRVVNQLAGRSELIHDLKQTSSKFGGDGLTAHEDLHRTLDTVTAAQKQARNLGEDLMEDLLTLDSLSNLASEDRLARKRAISEIESLLSVLDTAKVELGMFRKKLEDDIPQQTKADSPSSGGFSENGSPNNMSQAESTRGQKSPDTPVKKVRRTREEPDMTSARCRSEKDLFTVSAVPGREFWEQVELHVEFKAYEQGHCYVVEATVPEFEIKDLNLRMNSDGSRLIVEGVRLPTSTQNSMMQREVASRLGHFARRCPDRFIHLGGAPALSQQAFIDVGQGHFGRFCQTFSVPDDVVVAQIEALYHDGNVKVILPKRRVALGHMAPLSDRYYGHHRASPFHHMGMPFF